MRRTISPETWQQARTAHASGIGLRELARNMGIPEATVLARAKREVWTQQIQQAKTLATRPADSPIVAPAEAAAVTMRERAQRHVVRIAGITERVLPHRESMEPAHILAQARNLERLDYTARRNYERWIFTTSRSKADRRRLPPGR